jgi:ABC-type transport system involved in multi-copper enzyme maturation permease subunit
MDLQWLEAILTNLWFTIAVVLLVLGGLIYFTNRPVPGKLMAVAQAAYREAIRQPLFLFLLIFSLLFQLLMVWIPYFTLGEDMKMMKGLQLDAIMLPMLVMTVFTSALSVSEEIEGRTAITLLSKPVSRRQFLLGKFVGLYLAALLMGVILALFMGFAIHYKYIYDEGWVERSPDCSEIKAVISAVDFLPGAGKDAIRYVLLIFHELRVMMPGVVMIFCQVMILTAIAVALATRLPLLVNLVTCGVMFTVGRLAHVLKESAGDNELVKFVAQVFETVLPSFNFYDIGPAISTDVIVPWVDYVSRAFTHCLLYTTIALFFGLILFEDRDVA